VGSLFILKDKLLFLRWYTCRKIVITHKEQLFKILIVVFTRVIENKVASKVNLERRGIQIESNLCNLCRLSEESTKHLFFGCRVAWLIWNLCYDWLGMNLVDLIVPGSYFEHFKIFDAPNSVNLIMGNIWIALVSEIWRHRNNCLFKGGVVDHTEVFYLAQVKV